MAQRSPQEAKSLLFLPRHQSQRTEHRIRADARRSPNPGSSNDLADVAATSTSNAWAVGELNTGASDQTLILHWNGTKWARVPSPSPAAGNDLTGVGTTSASNTWAVDFTIGGSARASDTNQALILHWNGTAWKQVPAPSPGGFSSLSAMAATSASSVWAVGRFSPTVVGQALAIHGC